jgi:antitoxin (DNA-binding transcriptional repressor) of toxin-antitoxin stability system
MHHMKNVSVRDLRYDFPKVERILREGKAVQITKRKVVIARLVPEPPPAKSRPDFIGRMATIYGDRILTSTGAEIVRQDRDRY